VEATFNIPEIKVYLLSTFSFSDVESEVLMMVAMKSMVFWVVIRCSLESKPSKKPAESGSN
jgi:hypothetical protein